MKKLIRSEKNKLIERAKTLIIALLFLLCLFLGYRILRLYKTQTNVDRALWGGGIGGEALLKDSDNLALTVAYNTPQPQIMILNSHSARSLVDANSQAFDDLSRLANQLIVEMYGAKNEDIMSVPPEVWERTLNTDSVYIKYPLSRYVNTDISFFGIKSSDVQNRLQEITEMIVSYAKGEEDAVKLYLSEKNDGNVISVKIAGNTAREFIKKAKKIGAGQQKNVAFAWELNLDEKSDSSKAVLDSMLALSTNETKSQTVSISVPKSYKAGLNFTGATDLTLELVNAFHYNPNTIRQYVSRDNSIMFVGETGSLNLHPKGIIEYKALDSDDGVSLSSGESLDKIFFGLGGMIEKLMRLGGINIANADFKVKLTGVPKNYEFEKRCEFDFDYFAGDKKVELSDSYAIRVVVQRGNLVELKMILKDIKFQGKEEKMEKLSDAIDKFCTDNPECKKINDAYAVYACKEDGEDIKAKWRIEGAR